MNMVAVNNLVKTFPQANGSLKYAVNGLSFQVAAGEIYGLLGPNGAGKTTTLRMLSGMMSPTSGTALINGVDVCSDPARVKTQIGFLTANTALYPRLSPRETLIFFGEMHGHDRVTATTRADQLIDWLQMHAFANERCGALSTGQRQRTNIARSLVANPPILIMDEPTLGLDVLTNRIILDFILRERDQGKSIILSTHYLHEAEDMCTRIGLLHQGQLVAEGTLAQLRKLSGAERLVDVFLTIISRQGSDLSGMRLSG
ncbi:MAG: ABC transporter ATP-binding protein NatA [Phycisphaerae bacterium]|nr:ABC transporter ATP-binding protein NatA [Phycisphaerae bacterium]